MRCHPVCCARTSALPLFALTLLRTRLRGRLGSSPRLRGDNLPILPSRLALEQLDQLPIPLVLLRILSVPLVVLPAVKHDCGCDLSGVGSAPVEVAGSRPLHL